MLQRLQSLEVKLEARQKLQNIKDDIAVLKVSRQTRLAVLALQRARSTRCRNTPKSSRCRTLPHTARRRSTSLPLPPRLQSIWLKKIKDTDSHKERLESFYGAQAHA